MNEGDWLPLAICVGLLLAGALVAGVPFVSWLRESAKRRQQTANPGSEKNNYE